jgi:hypothetical protein
MISRWRKIEHCNNICYSQLIIRLNYSLGLWCTSFSPTCSFGRCSGDPPSDRLQGPCGARKYRLEAKLLWPKGQESRPRVYPENGEYLICIAYGSNGNRLEAYTTLRGRVAAVMALPQDLDYRSTLRRAISIGSQQLPACISFTPSSDALSPPTNGHTQI